MTCSATCAARIDSPAHRRSEECIPYSFKAPTSTSQRPMSLTPACDSVSRFGAPQSVRDRCGVARTWSAAFARRGTTAAWEASRAGLSGIVIWGLHRDTTELQVIRLPVFSLGALPAGPQRLEPQDSLALLSAACGQHIVTADDFVLGDDDGVLSLPLDRAGDVADLAANIRDTERSQAARMQLGTTFRSQSHFDEYIAARQAGRDLTFRQYLRSIGGAIEE